MKNIQDLYNEFNLLPIDNENSKLYENLLSLNQVEFFTIFTEILNGRLDIYDTVSFFYSKTNIPTQFKKNILPNNLDNNLKESTLNTLSNGLFGNNEVSKEALMLLDFTDEKINIQKQLEKQGVIIDDSDVDKIIIGMDKYKVVSTDIEKNKNKEEQLKISNLLSSKNTGTL